MVDDIVAHAREEWPKECCGVVAADDGRATQVYRAANSAKQPNLGYLIEGIDLYRIWSDIEGRGWVLEAIYHSHPKSPAVPSQTDINLADQWPDALYLIVSLEDPDNPDLRGYRIADGKVDEAELAIS
jgi:proteasome lid subunit RPN8/RPN11